MTPDATCLGILSDPGHFSLIVRLELIRFLMRKLLKKCFKMCFGYLPNVCEIQPLILCRLKRLVQKNAIGNYSAVLKGGV